MPRKPGRIAPHRVTEKNSYIDKRLQYGVCLSQGIISNFWLKIIPSNSNFDFCFILEIEAFCFYIRTVYKAEQISSSKLKKFEILDSFIISWFKAHTFGTEQYKNSCVQIEVMEVSRILSFLCEVEGWYCSNLWKLGLIAQATTQLFENCV